MTSLKKGWVALLFLLVIPITLGAEAGSLSFTATGLDFLRNGVNITSVSTNYPRLADMQFKVIGGEFDNVKVETEQLGEENSDKTLIPGSNSDGMCTQTGDGNYSCEVHDLLLKPESGDVNVPIEISENGTADEETLTYSFHIDNTRPTVEGIGVAGCSEDCTIGPQTDLQVEMQDSDATFQNGFVFFNIDSRGPYMVDSCSGMTCNASVSVNCQNGETVEVEMGSYNGVPTQDDAGNPIDRSESVESAEFTCDRTQPEIENITIETDSSGDTITMGSEVTITINASDDHALKAEADLSGFGAGTQKVECSGEGEQECTFGFTVSEDGYKRFSTDFRVSDHAGNSVHAARDYEILQAGGSITGAAWSVSTDGMSPDRINRRTLKHFDRKVYLPLDLEPSSGALSVTEVKVDMCESNLDIATQPMVGNAGTENAYLTLDLSSGTPDADKVKINCSVNIYSRLGDKVYEEPDRHNLSVEISLYGQGDVSQMVMRETNATRQKVKEIEETVGQISGIVNTFTSACQAYTGLETVFGILGGTVEPAVCSIPVVGPEIAQTTVKPPADGIHQTAKNIFKSVAPICKFMTCRLDGVQTYLTDALNNYGFGPGGPFSGLGMPPEQLLRPEKSLPLSIGTACLPGIVHNLEKKKSVECEYMRCMQQDVPAGLPPQECSKNRNFLNCKYTTAGWINAVPPLQIVKNLGDMVMKIASNPLSLAGSVGSLFCGPAPACNPSTDPESSHIACSAVWSAEGINHMTNMINNIGNIKDLLGMGSQKQNYCDKIINQQTPYLVDVSKYTESNEYCGNMGCSKKGITMMEDGETRMGVYELEDENAFVIESTGPDGETIRSLPITKITAVDGEAYEVVDIKNHEPEVIRIPDSHQEEAMERIRNSKSSKWRIIDSWPEDSDFYDNVKEDLPELIKATRAGQIGFNNENLRQDFLQLSKEYEILKDKDDLSEEEKERKREIESEMGELIANGVESGDIEIQGKSTWEKIGRAMQTGLAIDSVTNLVMPDTTFGAYGDFVDNKIGDLFLFDWDEEWVDNVCRSKFNRGVAGTGALLRNQDGRTQTAAHIEGVKDGPVQTENGEKYLYVITASVTKPEEGSIDFKIYAETEGGDKKVLQSNTQAPLIRSRSNPLKFNSTTEYQTACIEFQGNVEDKFDTVLLTENRLCNELI